MKYTIRIENQEYEVEIKDLRARPIKAVVDGEEFEIIPSNGQNHTAAPTSAPAAAPATPISAKSASAPSPSSAVSSAGTNVVRAPIPGVILEIKVKPGETVAPGAELFIIEAMKMKNTIRATRSGVIDELHTAPGTTVNHNAPILSYRED